MTAPDAAPKPEKLDARLAAVARLPLDTVKAMLARDAPSERTQLLLTGQGPEALPRPLTEVVLLPPPPVDAKAPVLHGLRIDARGEIIASVVVWFRGSSEHLVAAGARVRSVIGDVATAEIPLAALPAVERDDDVLYIALTRPLHRLLDRSTASIGVERLHRGSPPARRAGVVVGVIDMDGLAVGHLDFRCPSDPRATRVAFVWDQHGHPAAKDEQGCRAPAPWDYGVEHRGEHIDRGIVPDDTKGEHGTHVAGIAAGNGAASAGRYCGVAPEADLVFVNLRGLDVGDEADLIDALAYVSARAADRPAVVNISLGLRLGPRNGRSLTDKVIDQFVAAKGRVVVVAAGNDGESRRHKQGPIPPGRIDLDFEVRSGTIRGETIEIRYPAEELLRVTIVDPSGARTEPSDPGQRSVDMTGALVTVSSTVGDAATGDNVITVFLQPPKPDEQIAPGTWIVELERSAGPAPLTQGATYYAVIAGSTSITWSVPTPEGCTLASLAAAEGAIAVANYMHLVSGKSSSTSSRGPTHDGRQKPDFAAPGTNIIAPSASPDQYARMTGTSMAAPHVAGLAALLLGSGCARDAVEVKALLRGFTDRTGLSGQWDPAYGFGRVRAPASVEGDAPSSVELVM